MKQLSYLKSGLMLTALLMFTNVEILKAADTLRIDQTHSTVGFSVTHLMINEVKGRFTEFKGSIILDSTNLDNSNVDISIKVGSIFTGVKQRDTHLKSADFFWDEKHPEITFKSNKIKRRGKEYIAKGLLTMRGVSKKVEIPFTIAGPIPLAEGKLVYAFVGNLDIDRYDYDIKWNRSIGKVEGFVIDKNVKIQLDIEAIRG